MASGLFATRQILFHAQDNHEPIITRDLYMQVQEEMLKRANARQDYEDLADEIDCLREMKQKVMLDNAEREGVKQRISQMQQFLAGQTEQIEEYDENLVRRMVEKIYELNVS